MNNIIRVILVLLLWNLIVFLIYGWDKRKSIHGEYRIKEDTLLTCALLMGAYGSLAGMLFFHHKTKKMKFYIAVPICLLLNSALLFFMVYMRYA